MVSDSTPFKAALQAAGHKGAMQSESGELFYKPAKKREIMFYQTISQYYPDLLLIVPTFYGTLSEKQQEEGAAAALAVDTTKESAEESQLLVLKSSLYGFSEPCILDIKLGSQLWDELEVTPEKRDRLDQVSATTTSGSLSLRIAGMNVFHSHSKTPTTASDGERIPYDKYFGRQLTKDNFVTEGLAKFFPNFLAGSAGEDEDGRFVLEYFVSRLKFIHETLSAHEFRMRSASLLFVYEGDRAAFTRKLDEFEKLQAEEEGEEEEPANQGEDDEDDKITSQDIQDQLFKLDLIDFAHVRFEKGIGPDEGVLKGIQVVIDAFEGFLEKM
jgi:1D-myo-inositol-tetrakisphosphate 5-kinase/inositol-polyphosphate multikinase